jgi:AraC-like DNA-binding protein
VLLTGTYEESTEISRRLLGELPPLAIVRAAQWRSPLVDLLATEIAEDSPGQVAVLDRLLDLILVSALRTWFDTEQSGAPLWWTADSDPLIGPALRMIYDDPARAWTIAALAREVGISRAGFARRFTQTVGEPPMAFITRLRLAVAADLLRNDDMTIAAVARDVGYASPFALSTAFKREFGVSPHQHRVAHTATPQTSAPSSATASRAMRPTAT